MGTVGHNAFEGCQKCNITGKYINERMSFPYSDCPPRTDFEFRNRSIPTHHKEKSILENLPIDMINDFVTSFGSHEKMCADVDKGGE